MMPMPYKQAIIEINKNEAMEEEVENLEEELDRVDVIFSQQPIKGLYNLVIIGEQRKYFRMRQIIMILTRQFEKVFFSVLKEGWTCMNDYLVNGEKLAR